jgi:hypothetical protein
VSAPAALAPPPVSAAAPLALQDTLDAAARALHLMESGDLEHAEIAFTEAAVAAAGAYPPGSEGQQALQVILDGIAAELARNAAGRPGA